MRTVMYYVPADVALALHERVRGVTGYWQYSNMSPELYDPCLLYAFWRGGETGCMTLAQEDLDRLVARGLVVLGDSRDSS